MIVSHKLTSSSILSITKLTRHRILIFCCEASQISVHLWGPSCRVRISKDEHRNIWFCNNHMTFRRDPPILSKKLIFLFVCFTDVLFQCSTFDQQHVSSYSTQTLAVMSCVLAWKQIWYLTDRYEVSESTSDEIMKAKGNFRSSRWSLGKYK